MTAFAQATTVALAFLGLGLIGAIMATALVDLWRHTAPRHPFRRVLIVAALVFVAALFAAGVVTILSTVVLG